MKIEKQYHFYAGHRNQSLHGKCGSLHGHRYGVTVVVEGKRTQAGVTILFEDIDTVVGPVIDSYDHALILDKNDPLSNLLAIAVDRDGQPMKTKSMSRESSVENISADIFFDLHEAGLPVVEIRVQETDSATVIYTRADYRSEHRNGKYA